ncbi:hypothetical protein D9M68_712920 [compost metagenome]
MGGGEVCTIGQRRVEEVPQTLQRERVHADVPVGLSLATNVVEDLADLGQDVVAVVPGLGLGKDLFQRQVNPEAATMQAPARHVRVQFAQGGQEGVDVRHGLAPCRSGWPWISQGALAGSDQVLPSREPAARNGCICPGTQCGRIRPLYPDPCR